VEGEVVQSSFFSEIKTKSISCCGGQMSTNNLNVIYKKNERPYEI